MFVLLPGKATSGVPNLSALSLWNIIRTLSAKASNFANSWNAPSTAWNRSSASESNSPRKAARPLSHLPAIRNYTPANHVNAGAHHVFGSPRRHGVPHGMCGICALGPIRRLVIRRVPAPAARGRRTFRISPFVHPWRVRLYLTDASADPLEDLAGPRRLACIDAPVRIQQLGVPSTRGRRADNHK